MHPNISALKRFNKKNIAATPYYSSTNSISIHPPHSISIRTKISIPCKVFFTPEIKQCKKNTKYITYNETTTITKCNFVNFFLQQIDALVCCAYRIPFLDLCLLLADYALLHSHKNQIRKIVLYTLYLSKKKKKLMEQPIMNATTANTPAFLPCESSMNWKKKKKTRSVIVRWGKNPSHVWKPNIMHMAQKKMKERCPTPNRS